MSEQLRECPFCGKATAHALIAKEQMPGYRAWKLSVRGECTNQGCRTLGPQYSLIVPQDIDPPYKTEEWHAVIDQAIAAWNQRAGEAERTLHPLPSPCLNCDIEHSECPNNCENYRLWDFGLQAFVKAQSLEAELASLRQEKNEAIAAALAVEQRNYDQAQELAALRALREAAQYVCDCWQIDSDNEHAVVPFGPASMLQDMLAAWDGGSVCMGQDIGGRG